MLSLANDPKKNLAMDYLSQKVRRVANYFLRQDNYNLEREKEVSTFNVYLDQIFKILSWEDKKYTLKAFLALNHIFWLILLLHLKFYGSILLVIFVMFILDTLYYDKVLSEYEGQYCNVFDDITYAVYEIYLTMQALRKESPFMFAAAMTMTFLTTRAVSQNISGYALTYLLILGIFFIPLGYRSLPEEQALKVKQMFKSVCISRSMLAEEELIPFISNKDFSQQDPELESLLTDRTADSVTNSLTSGISAMPSYLDVSESYNDIAEEDLIPQHTPHRLTAYTPGEMSSDSDSDHREIQFDSDHFNTSSSEEEKYSMGLKFSPDVKEHSSETDGIRGMLSSVIANMGGNLVANILKTTVSHKREQENNSSDSDFEIVNSSEIDE